MNRRSFLTLLGTATVLRKLPLPESIVYRETFQWNAGVTVQDYRIVMHEPPMTLLDWAKRMDPNEHVPAVIALLEETNEILRDDLHWRIT